MSEAQDNDQNKTTIIRHGLKRGSLPDEVKKSLVARGLGEPLTQILSPFVPSDGIGAYPCLVLEPTSGEIESSLWALRGGRNWNAGYRARQIWGKDAPDVSLTLDIPNDAIQFPGDTQLKSYSIWQDAFQAGWAQILDDGGNVIQDIDGLQTISE